jgi:hypothetical protein
MQACLTYVKPWFQLPVPTRKKKLIRIKMYARNIHNSSLLFIKLVKDCWVWGVRRQNEPVLPSPMRAL